MNPTVPATPSQPVVEFIRGQRQSAAYVFLGLAALVLVGTILLAVKAFQAPTLAADKPAETQSLDPEKPPELPKTEIANPKRSSYMIGWIGGLLAFLITVSVGVYLQIIPPKPTRDQQLREARVVLLAAGGLLGAALILFGAFYFYLWSDSLTKWLVKDEKKEMIWMVVPLLMVAAGAGLVFASVQPARAEERNNLQIRRLVYGSVYGVTVLLLFKVLVILNVVVAMKVPNQLDTTETGFYTLSASTRAFLGKLGEPATLYVIMPDSGDRDTNDIRQFVYSAQEASEGKLTVKFVSPVTNRTELARLLDKYPRIGRDAMGILLTAGEDEKRNAFIPYEELFEIDQRSRRPTGFAGEGKAMKELRFLADNEQKPVVYFTQSNGELSIDSAPGAMQVGASANQLKAYLDKSYLDVRPLQFAREAAIPEDASVVVVAEPQTPLSAAAVAAIRKYMTNPRPDGRKGKLIVLAGATPGADNKGVAKIGLEELLAEFNVKFGDKYVYSAAIQQAPDFRVALAGFASASSTNPIYQTLEPQIRAFALTMPREIRPLTTNPQFQATTLLQTLRGRPTWLEDDRITDPEQVERDLQSDVVRARRGFTAEARSMGVVVSEASGSPHGGTGAPGGTGRMLVIGNSFIFTDKYAERIRGTPASYDLMTVSIDWLRDRPSVATSIDSKKYKEYQPPEPSTVDTTRLVYLPLGLALLLVTGVGTGVWVIRRK